MTYMDILKLWKYFYLLQRKLSAILLLLLLCWHDNDQSDSILHTLLHRLTRLNFKAVVTKSPSAQWNSELIDIRYLSPTVQRLLNAINSRLACSIKPRPQIDSPDPDITLRITTVTFKVIQGHSYRRCSIDYILMFYCNYVLNHFQDIINRFSKHKKVAWSWRHPLRG